MGLTDRLATLAVRGAHVLVVEVPGFWQVRAAVERAALDRGWHLASAPAGADVLVVCGRPGPQLAAALDRVWDQLPGPRVRIAVGATTEAVGALDAAVRQLADTASQREDARRRRTTPELSTASRDMGHHAHMGHPMEMGDQTQMDMGDHLEMDMGDHMQMGGHMGMGMAPGGIALAGGAADRDGLEMDALHLRFGPVTRYWPSGLILRCTLHGDVIARAEVDLLDAQAARPPGGADSPRLLSAWWCDHLTTVLALAGRTDSSSHVRRVRDSLLAEEDERAVQELSRLARRIKRSTVLRWALRDLGVLTAEEARRFPVDQAGDAWDRLMAVVDHAERAAPPSTAPPGDAFALVPRLVEGLDLATARLVVASLCLDPFDAMRART